MRTRQIFLAFIDFFRSVFSRGPRLGAMLKLSLKIKPGDLETTSATSPPATPTDTSRSTSTSPYTSLPAFIATSKNSNIDNTISYASSIAGDFAQCEALIEEIGSGRTPPYSIQGTMLLIRFHTELIGFDYSRYEELFDVYHGKLARLSKAELEVLFKGSADADHRILAFSFMRDFLRRDPSLAKDVTFYFGSGVIEFGEVNDSPCFFGETVDAIRREAHEGGERTGFLGFIPRHLLDTLAPFGQFEELGNKHLAIRNITSVSEVLETYLPLQTASYFRHPEDLSQTLGYLSEKIVEGEMTELKDAFFKFKTFRLTEKNDQLLNAYKSLLNLLIRLFRKNSSLKHLISSCVAVSDNLLPPDCLDDELSELLAWCLQFQDLRLKANTIEALGHFDPNNPLVTDYLSSKFNRIASEALLIKARTELSDELTAKVLSFMDSSNPFFVASGLYLVGFICEYHFQKNQDYFMKNRNFRRLIERAMVFRNHTHSMVRSRARATLKMIEGLKGAA
ncbi:MAG: hypothetical protein IPK04_19250 [Bdellovibrionales bacterium]|nr:hypothetical protein [Bdellovibrionales bacterium]